ncbi:hypothetical protein HW555_009994 [Spodoptera exigua]|uniref:Uncharacterized protein n=1 Tax=Spodoptera exigua TaxID=7107 RepID=A0A835L674_SPOEX|nr:hypothetical protein HW555_009994 [Spodoptera exigua]
MKKKFKTMQPNSKNAWKCPGCQNKEPKFDNTNTPIRPAKTCSPVGNTNNPTPTEPGYVTHRRKTPQSSSFDLMNEIPLTDMTTSSLREIIKQEITHAVENIMKSVVQEQFSKIDNMMLEFQKSLSFFNEKYDEIKLALDEKCSTIQKLEKNLVISDLDKIKINNCLSPIRDLDKYHPALDIVLSLPKCFRKDQKIIRKPNYYKADYESIYSDLKGIDWQVEFSSCTNVNEKMDRFYSIINHIINKYVPNTEHKRAINFTQRFNRRDQYEMTTPAPHSARCSRTYYAFAAARVGSPLPPDANFTEEELSILDDVDLNDSKDVLQNIPSNASILFPDDIPCSSPWLLNGDHNRTQNGDRSPSVIENTPGNSPIQSNFIIENYCDITPVPSPYNSFDPSPVNFELFDSPAVAAPASDINGITYSPCNNDKRRRKRISIAKKDKGRLRERFQKKWKDQERKYNVNRGLEYRNIKTSCPITCRKKCSEKLTEDIRQRIFDMFWSIGDHSRQWDFLARYAIRAEKKRITVDKENSKRLHTISYYLPSSQGDNIETTKIPVCKTMFLRTLSISFNFVYTALEKSDKGNGFIETDQRGRHINHPKIINEDIVRSVIYTTLAKNQIKLCRFPEEPEGDRGADESTTADDSALADDSTVAVGNRIPDDSAVTDVADNTATVDSTADANSYSCIICGKYRMYVIRRAVCLIKATNTFIEFMKAVSTEYNNIEMLRTIETLKDDNCFYHKHCKTKFEWHCKNNLETKNEKTWHKKRQCHTDAYDKIYRLIRERVVENNECLFYNFISEKYIEFLHEQFDNVSNVEKPDFFSSRHLEKKLLVTFNTEIKIIFSDNKKYIAPYAGHIVSNQEFFKNIETRQAIYNIGQIIRREIINMDKTKLPEDITVQELIRGECDSVPPLLSYLLQCIICGDSKGTWRNFDIAWLFSHTLDVPDTPMWTGFNSLITEDTSALQKVSSLDADKLYNITTGEAAEQNTTDFLLNVESRGETLRNNFITEVEERHARFQEPLKKNPVFTFSTVKKKKKVVLGGKVQELRLQRDLFGQLLAFPSIKDTEHGLRENVKSTDFRISGPQQVRPSDFAKELKNIKFKDALVKFIINNLSEQDMAHIIANKIININHDMCYEYSVKDGLVIQTINEDLTCQEHEEADTKIVYHVCQMKQRGQVTIRCSDTDILIIMLGNMEFVESGVQISMDVGVGNSRRYIDVSRLYEILGSTLAKSLPAFHAMTGCDYNPALYRKGKKRPLTMLKNSKRYQEAFDFKSKLKLINNWTTTNDGSKMPWIKVMEVLVKAEYPFRLFYKTSYQDDAYKWIDCVKKPKATRNRRELNIDIDNISLAYQTPIPIDQNKHRLDGSL